MNAAWRLKGFRRERSRRIDDRLQQERFDAFIREFNAERPHEALDMKCPTELYVASLRP